MLSASLFLIALLKPSDGRPTGEVTAADLIAGGVPDTQAEELAIVLNAGTNAGAQDLGTGLPNMTRAGRLRVRVIDQNGVAKPDVLVEVEPVLDEDNFASFCRDDQGRSVEPCQTGPNGEPVIIFLEGITIDNFVEQSLATVQVMVSASSSMSSEPVHKEVTVIPPATLDVEITVP